MHLYFLLQTGANLSRLRSPRVWEPKSLQNNEVTSPPPYTPPPMLSPNRRGPGLFYSLTKSSHTAFSLSASGKAASSVVAATLDSVTDSVTDSRIYANDYRNSVHKHPERTDRQWQIISFEESEVLTTGKEPKAVGGCIKPRFTSTKISNGLNRIFSLDGPFDEARLARSSLRPEVVS
ncbi:unnamed protein product [Protopolystoma xenopodis]|uniref:Uncharacterized protein n=1 Tax=Protopolystoma xenopodis TaxID=117903 RepID=A0A3S5AQ03_9PLAT|nr:unnamed protein product [Protopolystoma xenopodis]